MQKIFLTVMDMSIVSGLVILAVLAVRALLKKAPRRFSYVLWAVALMRLLCPFAVESPLSLIPRQAGELAQSAVLPGSEQVNFAAAPAAYSGGSDRDGGGDYILIQGDSAASAQSGGGTQERYAQSGGVQTWLLLCAWLWPAGTAAVLVWGIARQLKLRRMLIGAVRLEGNVWLADHIPTAFVMGLARPRIYLPSSLEEPGRDYVIEHERAHIRRADHITRLLAFAALAVHWFNPLVWLAFAISGRDMEMSCDEAVMSRRGEDIRADYCQTLLNMSANKHFPSPCLLAFGEGDTGARVRNALKWRKPALWAGIGAAVLIAIACVLLLTDPLAKTANTVEISFPAYQDGRSGVSVYDPVYDFGPFTASLELPQGWTVSPPSAGEGDNGGPAAGECPLYTPVYLYDEKGQYAGLVGWSDFDVYTQDDVPEGDYYKTVYYALRLGAHYAWTDFELVKAGEKGETHTAQLYWQEELEGVSAAAWPQRTAPGVCCYDRDLGVYVCVQLDGAGATGKEISKMAETLELSASGQDRGGRVEIGFSGSYTEDGVEYGSGPFTASLTLPEGWTVSSKARLGERTIETMLMPETVYLRDELGNIVGSVGYRAFDPDEETPLIKRYAGMTDEDYFRTRVFSKLILSGRCQDGLKFACGTRTSETSTSRDYGEFYDSSTGQSSPYSRTLICHYDTQLNEYIVVTLDDEYITVSEMDELTKSISLHGVLGIGFDGYFYDSYTGKRTGPGAFTVLMELPEGWTLSSDWVREDGSFINYPADKKVYLYDELNREAGVISCRPAGTGEDYPLVRAGSWSDADYERMKVCSGLYTGGEWRNFESVSFTGTAETFTAEIHHSWQINGENGYMARIETNHGAGRYDKELGVYVTVELYAAMTGEDEAREIAESLDLQRQAVDADKAEDKYVSGFAGASLGAARDDIKTAFADELFEGEPLRRSYEFNGRPCVAYYEFDLLYRLTGGSYVFNDEPALTWQELIAMYSQLFEELTAMYGEAQPTSVYLSDMTPRNLQSVIDGKSDMCSDDWQVYSPVGGTMRIYLTLGSDGRVSVRYRLQ